MFSLLLTFIVSKQIGYYKKNGQYLPLYTHDGPKPLPKPYPLPIKQPRKILNQALDDDLDFIDDDDVPNKGEQPLFTKVKSIDPFSGKVLSKDHKPFFLSQIKKKRAQRIAAKAMQFHPPKTDPTQYSKTTVVRNYAAEQSEENAGKTISFKKTVVSHSYPVPSVQHKTGKATITFEKKVISKNYEAEPKNSAQPTFLKTVINRKYEGEETKVDQALNGFVKKVVARAYSPVKQQNEAAESNSYKKTVVKHVYKNEAKAEPTFFQKKVVSRAYAGEAQNAPAQSYKKIVVKRDYSKKK